MTVSSSQSLSLYMLLIVSTRSSLSPSTPEAISTALACSVYTVQPWTTTMLIVCSVDTTQAP
jgi:hypothetical protein